MAFPYRKALGTGCIRITQELGRNTDVGVFCEPRPLYFLLALLNQDFRTPPFQESREKSLMRRAGKVLSEQRCKFLLIILLSYYCGMPGMCPTSQSFQQTHNTTPQVGLTIPVSLIRTQQLREGHVNSVQRCTASKPESPDAFSHN